MKWKLYGLPTLGVISKFRDWLTETPARYKALQNAPTRYMCRRLRFPDEPQYRTALYELLSRLALPQIWEEHTGSQTASEMAAIASEMLEEFFESDCMIGAVMAVTWGDMPDWALICDGSTYARVEYPELYEKLDSVFIVDADSFYVPDLRSRFVLGAGEGDGLTNRDMAALIGAETVTLVTDEMPSHTHTDAGHAHTYSEPIPTLDLGGELPSGGLTIVPGLTGVGNADIQPTGGNEPHENMPPAFVLRYVIIAR